MSQLSLTGSVLFEANLLVGKFSSTNLELLFLFSCKWHWQTCLFLGEPVNIDTQISDGRATWLFNHSLMTRVERFHFSAQSINHLSEHYCQPSWHSHDTSRTCSQFRTNSLCCTTNFCAKSSFLYNHIMMMQSMCPRQQFVGVSKMYWNIYCIPHIPIKAPLVNKRYMNRRSFHNISVLLLYFFILIILIVVTCSETTNLNWAQSSSSQV